jgi:hypothetical protein
MEFKLKDMSYGLLLSHTFPGILLALEILVAFELFTPLNIFSRIFSIEANITNLVTILIFAFVSATIFGFILDGIHHFLFRKLEGDDCKIYEVITKMEQMQIYKHFVEYDLWYPYEAYANIGIAMSPGLLLLPYGLYSLSVSTWFIVALSLVYVIIFGIVLYEAYSTLKLCGKVEDALYNNFLYEKNNSTKNEKNC